MKKFVGLFLFAAGMLLYGSTLQGILPKMQKAPRIDGVLSPGEWDHAAVIYGVQPWNSAYLASRQGTFYFAVDDKHFYLAAQTELPPKDINLLSRVKKRDGAVFLDDSVELDILPPHGKTVYQLIANVKGTTFDKQYPVINGGVTSSDYKNWTPAVKVKSKLANGFWSIEMQIPLKDLDMAPGSLKQGQCWKINAGRSWRSPSQQTMLTKSFTFVHPEEMAAFRYDPQLPLVKFLTLGNETQNGKFNICFELFNPGSQAAAVACYVAVVSDAAPRDLDQTVHIPAGKSVPVALEFSEPTNVERNFKFIFKEIKSGRILHQRTFIFDPKAQSRRWVNPNIKRDTDLEFGVYPYFKKIRARFGNVDNSVSNWKSCKFELAFASGKPVCTLPGKKTKYGFEAEIPFDSAAGKYRLSMTLAGNDGKTMKKQQTFEIRKFPWEHNQIGCDRVIVPPYKPLKSSGRTVRSLMTGYEYGSGLFQCISAAEEKNLLAAPITLFINGKPVKEQSFKFTEKSPDRIKNETVFSWDGGKIRMNGTMDYDGFYRFTMKFQPNGKQKIQSAYLAVPLKKEYAQQIHSLCNKMKYNDAKFLPQKEGIIWQSSKSKKHPSLHGTFRPYVWLGKLGTGLVWLTETDRYWSLDPKKDALDIVSKANTSTLRIHLVNKPCVWDKEFVLEQAFQATPVRPMPDYRRRLVCRTVFPNAWTISTLAGAFCWASEAWEFAPAGKDYSFINYLRDRKFSKVEDQKIIDRYIKSYLPHFSTARKRSFENHMKRGIIYAKMSRYLIPYTNARGSDLVWEDYSTYMDEWWCSEYRAGNADPYNNTPTRSYQDKVLYQLRKLVREGMDGIYYDNIRDWTNTNPVTGPAYRRADGRMQPYFDFFDLREFVRRTAVMLYQEKKTLPDGRPLLELHMTNTNVVPVMAFGSTTLDLEAEYGSKDFQDRFTEGYLQSCTLGLQSGAIPSILIEISGKKRDFVTRTFLAVTLAYDLPFVMSCGGLTKIWWDTWRKLYSWGYSTKQVAVTPCWEKNPITSSCPDWRITSYSKKATGETVIAVCSFGDTANGTVDVSSTGAKSCIDWESGKTLPISNGKVLMNLKRHDFKLLKLSR